VVKNSYFIHVLLKKKIFVERILQYSTSLCTNSLKNTKTTHDLTLKKKGTKVVIENFIGALKAEEIF